MSCNDSIQKIVKGIALSFLRTTLIMLKEPFLLTFYDQKLMYLIFFVSLPLWTFALVEMS